MLEMKTSMRGSYTFTTRLLEKEEKKYYGIFVSHSRADNEKYLEPLLKELLARGLNPICDIDILRVGDDFQKIIENYLDCYAGVVIITENSLKSDWVNYEIGIFSGNGMPVYLWDPEDLLSYSTKNEISSGIAAVGDSHISQYLPAYHSLGEIAEVLSNASPYAEMFNEENAFLDKKTFTELVTKRTETVIAKLQCDIFDKYAEQFEMCKFGMLTVNFGMFHPDHGDGIHCYARANAAIENGICPVSGAKCALCGQEVLDKTNRECVVLNHVAYNGSLLKKGEADMRGTITECGCVVFHFPVHKFFGTEFKFILDVSDNAVYSSLMGILEEAGFNPTSSDSLNGGRIYLSLYDRRGQGLFRLQDEYSNNFFCPQAARESKSIK